MKYLLASLLSISVILQSSDTQKFPKIIAYTTISVSSVPYIIDATEAYKLHSQAKKHDFKASTQTIQKLYSHLSHVPNVDTKEWNNQCKNLNELVAKDRTIENHLSFKECFRTAQKQATPIKLSCRALGLAGVAMCLYKQSQG